MAVKNLILGLGNLLLGDEGVGVHAAQALIAEGCPEDTVILDVGTAILEALPALEQVQRVVVIDAVKGGEAPGSVYRMPFAEFVKKPVIASMHGFDLDRTLALTRRTEPPEVLVIGVEPASFDWSLELSPAVAGALPTVLALVWQEVSLAGLQKAPL